MKKTKTVIMMASNIKDAKYQASIQYGDKSTYIKPYHYASKGNNFYEFSVKL